MLLAVKLSVLFNIGKNGHFSAGDKFYIERPDLALKGTSGLSIQ